MLWPSNAIALLLQDVTRCATKECFSTYLGDVTDISFFFFPDNYLKTLEMHVWEIVTIQTPSNHLSSSF